MVDGSKTLKMSLSPGFEIGQQMSVIIGTIGVICLGKFEKLNAFPHFFYLLYIAWKKYFDGKMALLSVYWGLVMTELSRTLAEDAWSRAISPWEPGREIILTWLPPEGLNTSGALCVHSEQQQHARSQNEVCNH
jgi:hypothetical protein